MIENCSVSDNIFNARQRLINELMDESDLCRNEGASDIANLLDQAIKEIKCLESKLNEMQMRCK